MARKAHNAEATISKLREAEVLQAKGIPMPEIHRQLAITEQTYHYCHMPSPGKGFLEVTRQESNLLLSLHGCGSTAYNWPGDLHRTAAAGPYPAVTSANHFF